MGIFLKEMVSIKPAAIRIKCSIWISISTIAMRIVRSDGQKDVQRTEKT